MNNVNTNRQFLDYKGLETLWKNIKTTFPYRTESIADIEFVDSSSEVHLKYTRPDATGTSGQVKIPVASEQNAGIISATTYSTILGLQHGSADLVPIVGVKIDDNKVSLNDRFANIKLDYTTKTDNGVTRSYLSLVDANFIGGAHWESITEAVYNANTAGGTGSAKGYAKVKESGESYSYYRWNGGDNNCEPAYNNGKPVLSTPISKIDVTEFVKSGMLQSATYDANKLVIRLVWHTYDYDTGEYGTDSFEIPVGDFIDEYAAGEGIALDNELNYDDKAKNVRVIRLIDAKTDKLGGVKVAKDNPVSVKTTTSSVNSDVTDSTPNLNRYIGVETDKDDKAFVYVPWMNTSVTTEETASHGLVISPNNNTLTNNITLGEKTLASLSKADTGIQSLTILGYELGHDKHNQYTITVDDAITALDLKSASHVDTISKIDATTSDDSKLPTRGAVKTYVGNQITAFKESLYSYVTLTDFTIVRSGYAADDPYASHKGLQMFDKVELVDGELKSTCRPMSIYDIADFCPLTEGQINEICNVTQSGTQTGNE